MDAATGAVIAGAAYTTASTITIASLIKYSSDILLKLMTFFNWKIPGWGVHLIVLGVSIAGLYGYDMVCHLPFNFGEVISGALTAIGANEVVNSFNKVPETPVIVNK